MKNWWEKFLDLFPAIEKAQDISSMQVDELIGSLQNFELVMDNKT